MVSGGKTPYEVKWDNLMQGTKIDKIGAGKYFVTITDANVCSITQGYSLNEPKKIVIDLGKDITLCKGDSISLNAKINDVNATYQWVDDTKKQIANTASIVLKDKGSYTPINKSKATSFEVPMNYNLKSGVYIMILETGNEAQVRKLVVAQALYGESFEVGMQDEKNNGIQGIINKSQEMEQRFAFALMAADLNYDIAKLAGWAYTDTAVKTDEKYLYTIELNQEKNTGKSPLQVETGNAVASITDAETLPKPLNFIGIFSDKKVSLVWEYLPLRETYTAYYIEKSEDTIHFTPLSDLPIVNMNSKEGKPSPGLLYIDSLQQNNKKYAYRIRGKTIFGDYGPYSPKIIGEGKKSLQATPRIDFFEIGKNETITLRWVFPDTSEKDILGFDLLHSENDEDNSYKVVKNNLLPNSRTTITKSLSPSNYYKIRAIGRDSSRKESLAVLVQMEDTLPPIAPIQLTGEIDTLGIAYLAWKPNVEKDLEGYHIFRGIKEGDEMVRLTAQSISQPKYQDTVQLKSLNSKVYYYVTAIDKRKNQSLPSAILVLEKPDKVRPQPPVFKEYKIENGEIRLVWFKSGSDDVALHQLYRQTVDEYPIVWKMIYETKDIKPEYMYTDKDLKEDEKYQYYILAIDKHNLVSDKSQEIILRNIDLRPVQVIGNLTGIANKDKNRIELYWSIKRKDMGEIEVYRQKGNQKPSLWGNLPAGKNYLEDKTIQSGNTYILKTMLQSGKPGRTEKVAVEY